LTLKAKSPQNSLRRVLMKCWQIHARQELRANLNKNPALLTPKQLNSKLD